MKNAAAPVLSPSALPVVQRAHLDAHRGQTVVIEPREGDFGDVAYVDDAGETWPTGDAPVRVWGDDGTRA